MRTGRCTTVSGRSLGGGRRPPGLLRGRSLARPGAVRPPRHGRGRSSSSRAFDFDLAERGFGPHTLEDARIVALFCLELLDDELLVSPLALKSLRVGLLGLKATRVSIGMSGTSYWISETTCAAERTFVSRVRMSVFSPSRRYRFRCISSVLRFAASSASCIYRPFESRSQHGEGLEHE